MNKLLKLFKSQTAKDSLIIFFGIGVTAVMGFLFTVFLARSLGPDLFGVYSAVTALATVVYSIGDLGIPPALINFIPKNLSEKPKYLTTAFWLQFAVAIFVLLFFGIAAFLHNQIVPGSLATDLLLAGGLSVNYLFINFAQGIFTAEKRFWSYSLSQIIDAVVKIGIVFLLLSINHLSIGTALAANFISTILALFITFGRELYQTEFEITKSIVRKIFDFSKWIAFSRVFGVMISKIDVLLLNIMVGSFQTGIYSAASRLAFLFAMIVSGLSSVVTPRYSSFKTKKEVIKYSQKLFLLILIIETGMLVCILFAGTLVGLVYGAKYVDTVPVFRYLLLAMLPFPFTLISNSIIIYTYNHPSYYAKITAIQVIGMILLDLYLIPSFGAMAPVIAMAAGNLFIFFSSSFKLFLLLNGQSLELR